MYAATDSIVTHMASMSVSFAKLREGDVEMRNKGKYICIHYMISNKKQERKQWT